MQAESYAKAEAAMLLESNANYYSFHAILTASIECYSFRINPTQLLAEKSAIAGCSLHAHHNANLFGYAPHQPCNHLMYGIRRPKG